MFAQPGSSLMKVPKNNLKEEETKSELNVNRGRRHVQKSDSSMTPPILPTQQNSTSPKQQSINMFLVGAGT
jgi:hypothetical protein